MNRATPVILVVLGLLFLPSAVQAAVQSVTWNFYDEQTGQTFPENEVAIEHNGTAAVPFGITGFLDIEANLEPFMYPDGEIYFIPDPDGIEREFAGYASEIIFTQEGVYELDVYEYVLAPNRTTLQKLLALLFPVAQAAPPGWTYLETIRFTITEGPPPAPPCCSSVLFLPGFQGSALKEGSDLLWPPSAFSDDVARLAVTEAGESVNDIRVAGVLSDFYGTAIYSGFAEFMDGLTDDGTINAWKPFSYDWRLPLAETIDEGVLREGEDDPVYLVDEVINLASESKTGKVTIVAHSMGGLLGKMLIKKLEEDGNENLVDSFVMVGTPQLGTPQSAAALLHGDQQGIAGGIFVKSHVARQVAQNMQTAYSLLPSDKYFEDVQDPIISFNSNASFTEDWRARWGTSIDSVGEFREFITGTGVPRSSPTPQNLAQPEVLRSDLVQEVQDLHSSMDTYEFPSSLRVVQLAGWGTPTLKGVEYKNKHIIFQGYEPNFTREGDSTVLYSSALSSNVEAYFLNIFEYNEVVDSDIEHRNLVGAEPVNNLIRSLLNRQSNLVSSFISEDKPPINNLSDLLVVSTKSPVVLGVSDSNGNYTGIVPGQDLVSETLEVVEEIPGSTFIASGDDQFIFLPKEGNFTFTFEGTGTGPATVETSAFSGDVMNVVATYSDIPVTPQTKGSFTVNAASPAETFIQVDTQGTGEITTVAPDGHVPPPAEQDIFGFITSLKQKIKDSNIAPKQKNKLLKRLDKVERNLAELKNKKPRVFNLLELIFKKVLVKWSSYSANDKKMQEIISNIEKRL